MSETLFAFDVRNYRDCQKTFRGERNAEYYVGDYSIEAGSVIDVRADRKGVGSCSIIRLRSRSRLFFRRSWAHIREDGTDVVVLWFVGRGSLSVTHQHGASVVRAGDFAVTESTSPFSMECHTDEESVLEALHVVVPSHVFRRFTGAEFATGFCTAARARAFRIAERMLLDVFEDAGELSEPVEQLLLDGALAVIAEAIKGRGGCPRVRHSLADRRLQDVLRFIEIHLSDPRLSTAMVAEACGISPRYLSHLLKQNGSCFSTLVWEQRLQIASRWLASSTAGEISIAEIAFRVGFKSPAHFSRMFKRVFNKGPREYRPAGRAVGGEGRQDHFGGPGTLQ